MEKHHIADPLIDAFSRGVGRRAGRSFAFQRRRESAGGFQRGRAATAAAGARHDAIDLDRAGIGDNIVILVVDDQCH
jgi:hypothetical protein